MKINDEQSNIIQEVKKGNNIIIEAVAGSGKTTTLLLIANSISNLNFSILTYSRALKDEIMTKTIPDNLSVYTFHSFSSYAYGEIIHNDLLLNKFLFNNLMKKLQHIDVLMVDEVQDMTKQYFLLILIVINIFPNIKIILVGDHKQTIKDYIGAYSEFLTDAENIFKKYTNINGNWSRCKLSKSYRLTESITYFVNKHIYKTDYIKYGNIYSKNIKPDYFPISYLYESSNKINPDITRLVKYYINIYGIQNVLILAPSYRINNPGYLLAHELSHISHIIPSQDLDDKLNPLLLKNKLVFRTFASCKGLQSKCVIVIGFDENYFKYNDRNWSDDLNVPNVLSVVATRASEKLVIIADKCKTIRTIDLKTIKNDINILTISKSILKEKIKKDENVEKSEIKKSVVDFIKHKHPEVELLALSFLNVEYIKQELFVPNSLAPSMIKFNTEERGEIYESISHIYGRVIPKIFRYVVNKYDTILYYQELTKYLYIKYETYLELYNEYIDYLNTIKSNNVIDYIKYIKNIFACEILLESLEIKSLYLVRQISNLDWINIDVVKNSINLLCKYFNININNNTSYDFDIYKFEEKLDSIKINNFIINGIGDLIYNNIIYEFKYSENINNEYLLQIGSYLCMNNNLSYGEIVCFPSGLIARVSINNENKINFIKTLTYNIIDINNGGTFYDLLEEYINKYNKSLTLIKENNIDDDFDLNYFSNCDNDDIEYDDNLDLLYDTELLI